MSSGGGPFKPRAKTTRILPQFQALRNEVEEISDGDNDDDDGAQKQKEKARVYKLSKYVKPLPNVRGKEYCILCYTDAAPGTIAFF